VIADGMGNRAPRTDRERLVIFPAFLISIIPPASRVDSNFSLDIRRVSCYSDYMLFRNQIVLGSLLLLG
jgi:hypothetical protein